MDGGTIMCYGKLFRQLRTDKKMTIVNRVWQRFA
jgi:hypothetical protein